MTRKQRYDTDQNRHQNTLSRNKPIHSTIPNKTLTTANNGRLIFHLFLRLSFLLLLLYPSLQHRNLQHQIQSSGGLEITLRVCSLMVLIMYGMAKSINFALHPNSITTSGFTRSEQLYSETRRLGGCYVNNIAANASLFPVSTK